MNSHSPGGVAALDTGLPTAIGVDLGGTRFKVGWLSRQYELHSASTHPTLGHRPVEDVLVEIANAITSAREAADSAGHSIGAVGVGMAAVIDPNAGKIVLAPNFSQSWQQFPLASALQRLTSLPVYLLNDARSHLLAEWRAGSARNITNVLGITLGTGVGGGLILDGRLRLGPHCLAGEFGHITCDPHGLRCGCGSFGCVETYASGTAIAAAALRPLLQGRAPRLREVLGGNNAGLDAQAVAEAALLGDTECREIFVRAGEALGVGIANVMKIVEIERVVIGGGVAAAEQLLFDAIRGSIRRHCTVFEGCEPDLKTATVAQPGATGAAIWARERMNVMAGVPGNQRASEPAFPRRTFQPDDPRYRFPDTISREAAAAFEVFYTYYSQPSPIPRTQADWDARHREIEGNVLQMSPSDELPATTLGGVGVIRVPGRDTGRGSPLLIYTHGGGHTWLSARSTLAIAKSMAETTGYEVVSVDYTVSPRGTWRIQTQEVIAVYQALISQGYAPAQIGIFGDSAGGGLCCGSTLRMRDEGLPLPGALLLLSPWSDVSGRGDSHMTLAAADPVLTNEDLKICADAYAAPADQEHPYVSPVYGDYSKPFPPTLIQGGTRELLLSDFVRHYRAILSGGNEAILDLYEGMVHAYHTLPADAPEIRATYLTAARFWRARLG